MMNLFPITMFTPTAPAPETVPTWRAPVSVYTSGRETYEMCPMKKDGTQTNNAAELTAILETYPIIERDIAKGVRVTIVTDSQYAIRCCSTYGRKCATRGWDRLDIPNKALVRKAYETYFVTPTVQFMFVRAHTSATDIHSIGNRLADRLATTGCWADADWVNQTVVPPIRSRSRTHSHRCYLFR